MKHPGGRPKGSPNKVSREAKERLRRYLAPREAATFKRLFESRDDKVVLETLRLCLLYTDGRPREAVTVSHTVSIEGVLRELAERRLRPAAVETKLLPARDDDEGRET